MQRKPSSTSYRQQTIVSKPLSTSYRQQTIVIGYAELAFDYVELAFARSATTKQSIK
jgi:hypothetical protein